VSLSQRQTPPTRSLLVMRSPSQLFLDLRGLVRPAGTNWESLPEASRSEVLAVLARLLARAGLEREEETGV